MPRSIRRRDNSGRDGARAEPLEGVQESMTHLAPRQCTEAAPSPVTHLVWHVDRDGNDQLGP